MSDLIPETVLNGFRQLLHDAACTLPVSVCMRKSQAFMLSGSAADLEAYAVIPSEFEGVAVLRKLVEVVTAEEAAEICVLLRRLRGAPVEPAPSVKEDDDGGQCGRVD